MGDSKKDAVDSLLEFILADDTPVGPEDAESLLLLQKATDDAEARLAKARLQRAREGVFAASMKQSVAPQGIENARKLYDRAKAGDLTAGLTLAARFGDGSMDGDLDAILEDLAELEADDDEEN
ncbi:pantothenate synthetase [Aminobacter niigataensis]|uniref:Pantothenate synthetase n=1 Tax=Aminobacter niigataensis TaxID=83265 RepID=A0ABR6L1F2_9HYPH|nr:hypothetical protein [Aminobacter niigataensis]MBB4650591.1 pantothenate synthetase [Aminobacter niigataensis]